MSKAGKQILAGLGEALRFARGEDTGARVWQVALPDARTIREKLGLSQEQFARRFRINVGTLRNWEQNQRVPDGPARALLMVIDKEPEAVERALKAWRPKQVSAETIRPNKPARAKAQRVQVRRKRA